MPRIRRWMVAPRLGVALLGASAMLMAGTGLAQAAYGPPPPPVPVPGGFLTVVTSQPCDSGGTTIGPASGGNTETTVSVPAGDCQNQTQVTITEPDIAAIGNAGICGYQAVAGVGIIIQNGDGSVDNAFLLHPIVVTISSPAIKPGDIVVAWNGREFERVGVAEHGGSVTVKLTRAGENFFAILQPTSTEFDPCDGGGGFGWRPRRRSAASDSADSGWARSVSRESARHSSRRCSEHSPATCRQAWACSLVRLHTC